MSHKFTPSDPDVLGHEAANVTQNCQKHLILQDTWNCLETKHIILELWQKMAQARVKTRHDAVYRKLISRLDLCCGILWIEWMKKFPWWTKELCQELNWTYIRKYVVVGLNWQIRVLFWLTHISSWLNIRGVLPIVLFEKFVLYRSFRPVQWVMQNLIKWGGVFTFHIRFTLFC